MEQRQYWQSCYCYHYHCYIIIVLNVTIITITHYLYYNHHLIIPSGAVVWNLELSLVFSSDVNNISFLSAYYQTFPFKGSRLSLPTLSTLLKKVILTFTSFRSICPHCPTYFLVTCPILLRFLLFLWHFYNLCSSLKRFCHYYFVMPAIASWWITLPHLSYFQSSSITFTPFHLISIRALPITFANIFKDFFSNIASFYHNITQ